MRRGRQGRMGQGQKFRAQRGRRWQRSNRPWAGQNRRRAMRRQMSHRGQGRRGQWGMQIRAQAWQRGPGTMRPQAQMPRRQRFMRQGRQKQAFRGQGTGQCNFCPRCGCQLNPMHRRQGMQGQMTPQKQRGPQAPRFRQRFQDSPQKERRQRSDRRGDDEKSQKQRSDRRPDKARRMR